MPHFHAGGSGDQLFRILRKAVPAVLATAALHSQMRVSRSIKSLAWHGREIVLLYRSLIMLWSASCHARHILTQVYQTRAMRNALKHQHTFVCILCMCQPRHRYNPVQVAQVIASLSLHSALINSLRLHAVLQDPGRRVPRTAGWSR